MYSYEMQFKQGLIGIVYTYHLVIGKGRSIVFAFKDSGKDICISSTGRYVIPCTRSA